MNELSEPKPALVRSGKIVPVPDPETASAKAAIRRCDAAWKRVFDVYMEVSEERQAKIAATPESERPPRPRGLMGALEELLEGTDEAVANNAANRAYRRAMPVLTGYDNVRDFIACAAHGVLIGALTKEDGTALLYAAQVALGVANQNRKTRSVNPA